MSQPGWYPDPAGPMTQRWWDGRVWSASVRPAEPVPLGLGWANPAQDVSEESQTGRRATLALIAGTVVYGAQFAADAALFTADVRAVRKWINAPTGADGVKPTLVLPHMAVFYSISSVIELALLAVAVCFLVWFYKVVTVARRLGLPARWSPSWAMAGWFIPIVSFWFPYQAAVDCLPPGHPGRSVVKRWWALWVGIQAAGLGVAVTAFLGNSHAAWAAAGVAVIVVLAAAQAGTAVIREINRVHAGLLGR